MFMIDKFSYHLFKEQIRHFYEASVSDSLFAIRHENLCVWPKNHIFVQGSVFFVLLHVLFY
jgi:hypothetical protein